MIEHLLIVIAAPCPATTTAAAAANVNAAAANGSIEPSGEHDEVAGLPRDAATPQRHDELRLVRGDASAGRTPVPLWPIHAGLGEDVQRGQGRDQAVGAGLWQGSANLNFVATGDRPWLLPGPVPTPVVGGPRLPPSAFQFVFYRDPLERFLSTFLDKCAGWRIVEGHCEPISIFGIGGWEEAKKQNPRTDPMSLLLPPRKGLKDRALFEAYIASFPITWNLHFFLQSTICRDTTPSSFDFVGVMNATFKEQLDVLRRHPKAPPAFQDAVTLIFELEPLGGRTVAAAAPTTRKPYETTNTRDRIRTYFTASSAKRLLRYYAEDYVRLGIALPEWLADMPFPSD